MSSLTNVILTEFRASGSQAMAVMGQMTSGANQLYRKLGDNVTMSERLNTQFKAIGTTIRYAIAGRAVFGLAGMYGQLKDIQVQLGLISAIGATKVGGQGGQLIQGQNLDKLFVSSLKGARDSITPVNEYNSALINLLSTVSDLPEDQLTPIVTTISQASKLAQVNAEDATKAFTTMNVAFGRQTNFQNIHRMAQEFFILTREAPGGIAAGAQVITQLGQLATVTRLAQGTPENMMGLLLGTLRSGIPPAQAGRGLQFLLQTIGLPGQQSKASREALASVGVRPGVDMPLMERLNRIFGRARKLGMKGNLGRITHMDDESLDAIDQAGGGVSDLGLHGPGAEFLGKIFHRIHALRTALALLQQANKGQLQTDLNDMNEVIRGHVSDVNDMDKAWRRFANQAKLQQIGVTLNAMSLQIVKSFEPLLNLPAGPLRKMADVMTAHPKETTLGAWATVAGVAALGGARYLRGGAAKGAGALQAAQSLAGEVPTGALTNPFYVRVIGGIFNTGTNPLTGGPVVATGGLGGEGEKAQGKWGKFGSRLARATVIFPLAYAGADLANDLTGKKWDAGKGLFHRSGGILHPNWGNWWRGEKASWSNFTNSALGFAGVHTNWGNWSGMRDLQRAQALWGGQVRGSIVGEETVGIQGTGKGAELTLNLTIKHPDGRLTHRKVHAPYSLFTAPSQKGKTGKGRT